MKMQVLHTSEDYCSCLTVQPPLSVLAGSSLFSLSLQDVFWTPCSFSLCCPDPSCLSHSVSTQSCTWGSLQRFPPCLVGYVPFTHPSGMFDFLCACDSAVCAWLVPVRLLSCRFAVYQVVSPLCLQAVGFSSLTGAPFSWGC